MDASSATVARRLLAQRIDWDAVLSLAMRHRVRPLLYASLLALNDKRIPSSVIDALQNFVTHNARRNLFLVGRLFNLFDLFKSHGIAAAAFKGPMLAMSTYGNAALREAGDIDLLVPRPDIVRARRLLTERGFCPIFPTASDSESAYLRSLSGQREISYLLAHAEHHLLDPRDGVNVDLHWALALSEFCVLRDWKEPWRWVRRQPLAGRTVWGFETEETLLILCINGAKDCWRRLDRICDIRELLERNPAINWDRVFETARQAGASRMVRLGLGLAEKLLGARLPDQARWDLRADAVVRDLMEGIRDGLFQSDRGQVEEAGFAKSILHLRMRERLTDRIAYCLARLEPTVGDWAATPLPTGFSWLHYILRPIRLALRFLRSMGGFPKRTCRVGALAHRFAVDATQPVVGG